MVSKSHPPRYLGCFTGEKTKLVSKTAQNHLIKRLTKSSLTLKGKISSFLKIPTLDFFLVKDPLKGYRFQGSFQDFHVGKKFYGPLKK